MKRELVQGIQSRGAMYDPSNAVRDKPVVVLTEDERDELCRLALRATNPDYVLVPQSALDWLFGAGPAADGRDFSDDEPPDKKPAYWWRSEFTNQWPEVPQAVDPPLITVWQAATKSTRSTQLTV